MSNITKSTKKRKFKHSFSFQIFEHSLIDYFQPKETIYYQLESKPVYDATGKFYFLDCVLHANTQHHLATLITSATLQCSLNTSSHYENV